MPHTPGDKVEVFPEENNVTNKKDTHHISDMYTLFGFNENG